MTHLAIIGLVNFNDWEDPAYTQTGGINSVIKSIIPYLKADKIVLYGYTYEKKNLLKEKQIGPNIVVFPIIYVPPKSALPVRFFGLLQGWRINKYLKKHGMNVAYTHAEEICFWLTFGNIRYVHHLHTFVNVLEISGRRSAKIGLFKQLWEALRRRAIKKAFKIVAINKDVADMVGAIVGRDRIVQFPNYVDTTQFSFRDSSALKVGLDLKDEKIALFVGRITFVKGLELFVDTVQMLNRHDRNRWKGVIIGNGDHESSLRNYIKDKGSVEEIVFAGSVNDPVELSRYYTLADVFLITSKSESVPLTLLESLACGTPVVSTRVGIAMDVLGHNNGFVIDSRDAEEFSGKALLCGALKSRQSLLPDQFYYSVEYASSLLNKEFGSKD